jgi:hypothetical protein
MHKSKRPLPLRPIDMLRAQGRMGEGCLLKQPKPLHQAPVVNEEVPLPKNQRTTTVFHSNKEGNMNRPRIRTSFVCAPSLFPPTQCFGNEEDTANPCRHPITNIPEICCFWMDTGSAGVRQGTGRSLRKAVSQRAAADFPNGGLHYPTKKEGVPVRYAFEGGGWYPPLIFSAICDRDLHPGP